MATADERGSGIRIDNIRGAVAIGNNNTVTHNEGVVVPPGDAAQKELLRAVRELRADLDRAVQSPQVVALSTALTDTESEITGTGAAGAGRLARLRAALGDAGAVVGLLASGTAVGQAVAALVGG
ncbi:hypothetical protein [Streptomyces sp. NPDC048650]|uniref:hypothetical protein n=1 Tax=unclassified Streptomyces TaxID=2593676 RepID=UPI00371AE4F8